VYTQLWTPITRYTGIATGVTPSSTILNNECLYFSILETILISLNFLHLVAQMLQAIV
jgi:hypothetical protein